MNKVVSYDPTNLPLKEFETQIELALKSQGLPTQGVFINIKEKAKVFMNLGSILEDLDPKIKENSVYLSKFIASIAAGLFDAALNFLRDETILHIRKKIAQGDIEYFYDSLNMTERRRSKFKNEDDLPRLADSDLIKGAKEIGLITDKGYKQLDHITYMRNRTSAAHPNHNEISGLELSGRLEICIKEVISLEESNTTVSINQILNGIKNTTLSNSDAKIIGLKIIDINEDLVDKLGLGLFSIYVNDQSSEIVRQNIRLLIPTIWNRIRVETKKSFGIKYSNFELASEVNKQARAKEFLELVQGEEYFPSESRIVWIDNALENLLTAHHEFNNFYTEPDFAKELKKLIGDDVAKIPKAINKKLLITLSEVFLSNGNGISKEADKIYKELIEKLSPTQANEMALSFLNEQILNKLYRKLCADKFIEMMNILEKIVISPLVKDLIKKIKQFNSDYSLLMKDHEIKTSVESLKIIIAED